MKLSRRLMSPGELISAPVHKAKGRGTHRSAPHTINVYKHTIRATNPSLMYMCMCADVELRANETAQTPILIPLHGQNPSYCNTHIQSMCVRAADGWAFDLSSRHNSSNHALANTHTHTPTEHICRRVWLGVLYHHIYVYIC
jgi:hypothetical protein